MERKIKRGDIYYADLNPVIGSEQGGTRPVLIISNNIGNKHSPTVIVAPITSRTQNKNRLPTHIAVRDFAGLDKKSVILLEQIRTIDKHRLEKCIGHLEESLIICVNYAIIVSLGIDDPLKTPVETTLCHSCANHYSILPYRLKELTEKQNTDICMCCNLNKGVSFAVSWK